MFDKVDGVVQANAEPNDVTMEPLGEGWTRVNLICPCCKAKVVLLVKLSEPDASKKAGE